MCNIPNGSLVRRHHNCYCTLDTIILYGSMCAYVISNMCYSDISAFHFVAFCGCDFLTSRKIVDFKCHFN